jgi:mannose-6-phosphate isomerase-like protein (cupin superfamily)
MSRDVGPSLFSTQPLPDEPDVTAPDGSDVRILVSGRCGSMAHFTLASGQVSRAVVHSTVEEIWYIIAGRGRMWRSGNGKEETVDLRRGVSLTIPVGARFQFRNDGRTPLVAVAVAMPPWPGDAEAQPVDGAWSATI